MKLVNWIIRKRREKLYKEHPCLTLEDSINYMHGYLMYIYNTNPNKFFEIMDALNIKHFEVPYLRVINLYIGDHKNFYQKISLQYPKC